LSAFNDGERTVPVQLEIKEFKPGLKQNHKLYITVTLNNEKEAGIFPRPTDGDSSHSLVHGTPASEISIADLIAGVKDEKGNLLKYLPDSMLDESQRSIKGNAITQEQARLSQMREEKQPIPIVNTGDEVLDNVIGELEPGKNIKARQVTAITKSRSAMRKLGQISGERITAITNELDQRKAITRALEQVRDRNATASERMRDDDVAGVARGVDAGYNNTINEMESVDYERRENDNRKNQRNTEKISGKSNTESNGAYEETQRGIPEQRSANRNGRESLHSRDSEGKSSRIRNKKFPKLGKTEYVLVRRAQMSKYGSMEEETMPDIGYVYAYDMFYYIENYGPGEFRVIYRFNPATAQERIKFFREVIDNGYNEESYGSTPLYQSSARNGDNEQRGYNGNSDDVGNGRRIRKDERMDEETDIENHADGHTEKSNGSKRNDREIEKQAVMISITPEQIFDQTALRIAGMQSA